jgi:transcriptional regulator with XRE-family HTH domain
MTVTQDHATLAQRLAYALKIRGIRVNALDRAIGKDRYATKVLNSKRENPGAPALVAMARALRVPFAWLAIGEGPLPVAEEPAATEAA